MKRSGTRGLPWCDSCKAPRHWRHRRQSSHARNLKLLDLGRGRHDARAARVAPMDIAYEHCYAHMEHPQERARGHGGRPRMGRRMDRKTSEVLQGTLDLTILKTLHALGPLHGFGIARRLEQVSRRTAPGVRHAPRGGCACARRPPGKGPGPVRASPPAWRGAPSYYSISTLHLWPSERPGAHPVKVSDARIDAYPRLPLDTHDRRSSDPNQVVTSTSKA